MDVLKAIRGIQSWEMKLSGQVIQNYFRKALDSQPSYHEPVSISGYYKEIIFPLKISTPIQSLMDINTFPNPAEEAVQDIPNVTDSQVLAQYGPGLNDDNEGELYI